jgi:cytoskeleton protein RodZ
MSDFAPLSSPTPFTQQPEEAPTAGLLLRRARQSAGLHAEALAASLKVPVQKIEALEADRFDLLPDLVFVRALAASICRTLDVDAQPVLERLPRKTAPRLAHARDRVNAPFRGPNDVPGPGWRDQLKRPRSWPCWRCWQCAWC